MVRGGDRQREENGARYTAGVAEMRAIEIPYEGCLVMVETTLFVV